MKAALFVALAIRAFAQMPDCAQQTKYTPLGDVSMWRNGAYLRASEISRTPVPGSAHPKFSPVAFADQDQIAILYTRAVYLPGTTTTWSYSLVREEWICQGNLNPPPKPMTVLRKTCIGSGTWPDGSIWDCTGIEQWTVALPNGNIRYYFAVASETKPPNIVDCPEVSPDPQMGCFQSIPINDLTTPPKYHAAYIVVLP